MNRDGAFRCSAASRNSITEKALVMKVKFLVYLFLILVCAATAWAQNEKLPGTPAGKRAAALLNLIRAGEETAIRQFFSEQVAPSFREAFPMEEHVKQLQRLRKVLEGAEVVGINMRGPNDIKLVLQVRGGKPWRVVLEVEPEPPNRIASIEFGPDETSGLRFSSFEELDSLLRRMADEDRFSGSVLVMKRGQVAFRQAYGQADRAAKIPNRPDTLFDIGSINKQFTSVVILRLAQEGKLKLDDTVGKYLKGFPPEIAGKVTIRQLLQHKSGMGDYLREPRFNENPKRFRTVSDYLELVRSTPLLFVPGTSQRYSNSGFVVLGGIIEAVTGRSYYDVVQDFVYDPAGMKASGSFEMGSKGKNMAIGYTRRLRENESTTGGATTDQLRPNTGIFAGKGSPAGGGYATAEDLKRYLDALLDYKLLDRRHTNLLLNEFSSEEPSARPALMFAGGAEGVNAVVAVNLQTRDAVIILANMDEPVAEELGQSIFRQLK